LAGADVEQQLLQAFVELATVETTRDRAGDERSGARTREENEHLAADQRKQRLERLAHRGGCAPIPRVARTAGSGCGFLGGDGVSRPRQNLLGDAPASPIRGSVGERC
jgi:hypothetical protein